VPCAVCTPVGTDRLVSSPRRVLVDLGDVRRWHLCFGKETAWKERPFVSAAQVCSMPPESQTRPEP